ncbi:MAG: hypothetical protein PHP75_00755, partial [Methylacidiphilaceae bacterium]|nr:hypothetical protein [Candidatus Methylacidiphilaceae bacterium]
EITRLLGDCWRIRRRNLTLFEWSRFLVMGLVPLPQDRKYLEENPMALAARMRSLILSADRQSEGRAIAAPTQTNGAGQQRRIGLPPTGNLLGT